MPLSIFLCSSTCFKSLSSSSTAQLNVIESFTLTVVLFEVKEETTGGVLSIGVLPNSNAPISGAEPKGLTPPSKSAVE